MDKIYGKLTVYFEGPFWVGVFERTENGRLTVCKVTFGAEPTDGEVYEFILKNYTSLTCSPSVEANVKTPHRSPKRMQREANRQLSPCGIGTKSQQALKLLQQQQKTERRIKSRAILREERERRFEQKQQKRKEKHKGH